MGCSDDIVHLHQSMIRLRWLNVPHIKTRSPKMTTGERICQCVFVVNGPACSVDEDCTLFHPVKRISIKKPARGAGERGMNRNDVGEGARRADAHGQRGNLREFRREVLRVHEPQAKSCELVNCQAAESLRTRVTLFPKFLQVP